MSNEKNLKALNKEWFDRVWNKHERNAIFELIDDDCQIGGLPPSDQSPKEAFATFHDTILGQGAVTLNVLDRIVNDWIAERKVKD